ncbi:MAG: ribonuclease HII [Armatimonadota bacterium]
MLDRRPGWAGADEAGRGPLAGPVVAAAVILPEQFNIQGLNDSKKLDPTKRELLETRIREGATFHIEFAWPDEIEQKNILHASLAAMSRAILSLKNPLGALIDGNQIPKGLSIPVETVVKGDGKIAEIAAASILAKNVRDRYMVEIATEFPQYGFDKHFGYPTPEHLEALRQHGPCPIHRRSFAPVAAFYQATLF